MSNKTIKQERPRGDYFRFSKEVKSVIRRVKKSRGWTKKQVVETAILSRYQ